MKNEFIELLKPQNIFMTKERLGPPEDGGYVMPKYVYENCSALYTYGVGHEVRFEEEFSSKYGKPVYMFDHTIGREKWKKNDVHFIPEGLGTEKNCKEFIDHYEEFQTNGSVFLKIDIEGGEYEYFKNVDLTKLEAAVMGLSLEIHWIDNLRNREDLVTVLKKLQEHFILCHIHGNNWGDIWRYEGLEIPKVMELSFINKNLVEKYEPDTIEYPIEGLDIPNNPKRSDYSLNFIYETPPSPMAAPPPQPSPTPMVEEKLSTITNGVLEHYYKDVPSGWFNYEVIYDMAINRINDTDEVQFVELGVWFGQSLCYAGVEVINSGKKIKIDGVDSFLRGDQPEPNGEEDPLRYSEALRFTDPVKDVATIVKGDTHEVYSNYADESIDFIFIDANHTYDGVMKDLQYWYPKLKKGGLFCGHDYEPPWPGLMKAVDEFFADKNIKFEHSCHTWIHHKD